MRNFNFKKTKKEQGISLPISLFVLIGVLLAATALLQTGDVSVRIAGSMSSRAQVGHSNDTAIRIATEWLATNKSSLDNDIKDQGYFSSYSTIDIDYTLDSNWVVQKTVEYSPGVTTDEFGNVSYYQIRRMCKLPNTPYNGEVAGVTQECALGDGGATSGNTSSSGFNSYNFSAGYTGNSMYYKIITKTVGFKGATVITETVAKI